MESETISASSAFMRLVTVGATPTLEELSAALDRLVNAYHQTPTGDVIDDGDAPSFPSRYREIAARFPNLGLYGVADPLELGGAPMTADAIDDLADIVRDIEEVLWTFDQQGLDQAHWDFRFLFQIHWGQHARQLAAYLHALLTY